MAKGHSFKQSRKRVLVLLYALCVISVSAMVFVLAGAVPGKNRGNGGSGAFSPPPFEPSAKTGEPQTEMIPEESGYSLLDAQAYQAALCGNPGIHGKEVFLYLTNPETNIIWLKVRIIGESGEILGESGLLKPGEYAESVTLDTVPAGDTPVQLKLMAYEPDTYHSAGAVSLHTSLHPGD